MERFRRSPRSFCRGIACDRKPGDESKATGGGPADESKATGGGPAQLDPRLLRFLDANRMEEKMEILDSMQGDVTDEMIDIMAISLDTEIVSGEASERIAALRETIQMRLRFESSRLRE